ncbi:MAG TPA: hypothetical protein VIQ76_04815 [Propionibacteriaceae bacterium]|jgi:hypothetical protein
MWTIVLDWSTRYGELEPPLAVVHGDDEAEAVTKAIELVAKGFAGVGQEWGCRHDVAERLFHLMTFRGDVTPMLVSEGHAVLRERPGP